MVKRFLPGMVAHGLNPEAGRSLGVQGSLVYMASFRPAGVIGRLYL